MLSATQLATRGQRALQRLAAAGRTEPVTLTVKATADATPTTEVVSRATVEAYDAQEVDAVDILRTDRRVRLAVADVTTAPTRWSTVTRADGTVWQVQTIAGGPGTPFWRLQCRQIG